MLIVDVPSAELYDEVNNEFITVKARTLKLEHSLVSLSKWESKWMKPFLTGEDKTVDEMLDYIRCMTIGPAPDPIIYRTLPANTVKTVTDYIAAPMTATTFGKENEHASRPGSKRQIITSELIYYDMIALGIPMECEKWHLNRLFTLIRVCTIKNTPSKKMSKHDVMRRNKSLNAQRRAKLHTRG